MPELLPLQTLNLSLLLETGGADGAQGFLNDAHGSPRFRTGLLTGGADGAQEFCTADPCSLFPVPCSLFPRA